MNKAPSKKGIIFCAALMLTAAIAFFIAGRWQMSIYSGLKTNCTAQVTGVVDNESKSRTSFRPSAENRYLTGKHWRHIKVDTDDVFKLTEIYANPGPEHEGDEVIICYDPNEPDNYYFGDMADHYRTAAVFVYAASGLMLVAVLIMAKMIPKN